MITDQNKGIKAIFYNHLNLPVLIDFGSTRSISYLYNALGQKVKKTVNHGAPVYKVSDTEYLNGGFQYNNEVLLFFPHAQGYVKNTPDKYGNPTYDYVYQYKDHLGNIRMNYALDPRTRGLKILEENHYYPFGLKHGSYNSGKQKIKEETEIDPKRIVMTPNSGYMYKFLGQERQDELGLNWDTFRHRNYDYTIGRFFGIDPITEEYMSISPYQFAHNNPVWKIELEGLEGIPTTGMDAINYEPVVNSQHPGRYDIPVGERSVGGSGASGNLAQMQLLEYTNTNTTIGGYPGQALDEFVTAGIQWIAGKVTGENVSKETSENIQLGTNIIVTVVSKGKNTKVTSEVVEQIAKTETKAVSAVKKTSQEGAEKLSKVEKSKTTETIGDKFTKKTEVRPGKGPGQSRAEYTTIKNKDGKTIKTYKDSYDRANKFQGRKPLRGGPEGRSQ